MMTKPNGDLRRMQSSGKLTLKPSKKEDYYQCGYQIHVKKAAIIIAALGVCISMLNLLIWRGGAQNLPMLACTSAMLIAHAAILCAIPTKIPYLYVPFLVINPIHILGIIRFDVIPMMEIVSRIPALKTASHNLADLSSGESEEETTVVAADRQGYTAFLERKLLELAQPVAVIELVTYLVACGLLIWFQMIIYRAYKYTVNKQRQIAEEVYRSVYVIEPRKKLQRMNTFVA